MAGSNHPPSIENKAESLEYDINNSVVFPVIDSLVFDDSSQNRITLLTGKLL